MSAIFISHSSRDGDAADEMRRWLEGQGHRSVFLDFHPETGIPAGQDWEQTLYREIKSCRAVIVLCSVASMDSKWCFTEITHARAMGKELFPVRLDDCVVEGVFSDRQVVDLTQGSDQAYERLRIGLIAAGLDPADAFDWDNSRPPYPGLVAFQEADAAIYFGRDDEIREALDRLGRIHRLGTTAMLMVLGASGTGKSSLVRAGLIPRVRRDRDRWIVLDPLRPQSDIVRGVARAFQKAFGAAGHSMSCDDIEARLVTALEQVRRSEIAMSGSEAPGAPIVYPGDGNPLLALAEELRVVTGQDDARVVMIVDQFEELLADPGGTGGRFLAVLRHAVERSHSALVVLGTMRSDFLNKLQEEPALVHFDSETLSLGPMPPGGIVDMIAKPAKLSGIDLEDGLIAQMVADAEGSGTLPMLAFTLQQLNTRYGKDKQLELVEYRNLLGGLRGSIATVAEELTRDVTPADMDLLRKAFLSMTRVTEDGVFARRPRRMHEMPQSISGLIDRFVDNGLLVARSEGDESAVEVAHEALYTSWGVLQGWLKQSAEALRLEHDIHVASSQWDGAGKQDEDLLRGGRLERAGELIESGDLPLAERDRQFIQASMQAVAAQARAAARRRRRVLQGVTLGFVVALALSALATVAWQRSVRASERAAAARLTTVAQASAENETELGMLTAVASLGITPTPNGWSALATALSQPILARSALEGHEAAVSAVAVSPDGTRLVSADWDGSVRVWDLATGTAVGEPLIEDELWSANAVAFSPDGTRFAVGGLGYTETGEFFGGVWQRDTETGALLAAPLAEHDDEVVAVAFSPDGSHLAAASLDGAVLLWDLTAESPASTTLLEPDRTGQRTVGSVAFRPNGETVIAGGNIQSADVLTGTFWVFDAVTGNQVDEVSSQSLAVVGLAYSPDGQFLASVGRDGMLTLWSGDLAEQLGQKQVSGSDAWANAVGFSPEGTLVATANSDGTVTVFDGETGNLVQDPLNAHRGGGLAVAFGRGVLVSGGADGGIRRYDLDKGQSIGRTAIVQAQVGFFAKSSFVADGSSIASVDFDDHIRIWDVAADRAIGEGINLGADYFVERIELSPDGRLMAVIGFPIDGDPTSIVVLVDTTTGERVGEPLSGTRDATRAVFSPDGIHLGVADADGHLAIWDLRLGPSLVGTIESPDVAGWLGFSPDGSHLASSAFDGTMRLWDVRTDPPTADLELKGHAGRVNAVAFSADGQTMASGSNDKTVMLWDLESGKRIGEPLLGHSGRVLSVALSPDATGLASAGADTTVTIRSLDDVDHPITLTGHRAAVSDLAFSADGSAVTSADDRGAVRLWPMPESWQRLACQAAGRNLSSQEWESIVGAERGYERQCPDLPSGVGAGAGAGAVTVKYRTEAG